MPKIAPPDIIRINAIRAVLDSSPVFWLPVGEAEDVADDESDAEEEVSEEVLEDVDDEGDEGDDDEESLITEFWNAVTAAFRVAIAVEISSCVAAELLSTAFAAAIAAVSFVLASAG